MHPNEAPLSPELVDRILRRLGLARPARADEGALADVYSAWSRAVPFDNVRKMVHLAEGAAGPLAGDSVVDFLEAWLAWGSGGTCWAGNGALCTFLSALGFRARRGVGTMMVAPDLPPNHGTVVVELDDRLFLVDASMLFDRPLLLSESDETGVDHPAWGVSCSWNPAPGSSSRAQDRPSLPAGDRRSAQDAAVGAPAPLQRRHSASQRQPPGLDGKWHVRWKPLHLPDGLDCRIDALDAGPAEFTERHEQTRGWSPFNFEVNARRNRDGAVVGLAFGARVEIAADGTVTRTPLDDAGRRRVLVEEIGIAPSLVDRLPEDTPTPPPPWSAAADANRRTP